MGSAVSTTALESSQDKDARRSAWLARHWLVLAAFTLLLIGATSARLLTFERYLPALDYSDESVRFLVAQERRGIVNNDWVEWRYAGHPPAYLWVNIGVQLLVEATASHPWVVPPDYFYALRLLAAIVGVITTFVIASIGWQLAGPVAAWCAGFIWALAPVIVERNSLAIPDPFVYLTCALAITLAIRAWSTTSPRWLFGSLIAAILAIYFKLWPVHSLIPWGIVFIILLRRQPRRMLRWLLVSGAIGILAAAYLFIEVNPLNQLRSREITTFNTEGITNMLTLSRNVINWSFALYPIGVALFMLTAAAGGLSYVYSRRRGWKTINPLWVGILLLYSFAGIVMASSFTQVWPDTTKIRHVLPMSVALIPLWAALLTQIVWSIRQWFDKHQSDHRYQPIAFVAVFALAGLFTVPQFITGNVELVERFRKPLMKSVVWHWADDNIPVDGLILGHEHSQIIQAWNRPWSGYDGRKVFNWWLENEDEILASTPADYVERNIDYFVIEQPILDQYFRRSRVEKFLSQLTLVKTFPASPDVEGDTVYFYRMAPPQVELSDEVFGDQIALVGYDLDTSSGNTIYFRPYWRIRNHPTTNYSMFVHLYPADALEVITQYDGAPTTPQRLTLTWDDPNELYIGADVNLTLPDYLPPGDYRLAVGLYDFTNGQRLLLGTGDDFYTIPVTIP